MRRELTGWHVFGGFAFCFGIIISVNLVLAFQAVATFPGLVVKNSYVASQKFDADRTAQDALGWDVAASVSNDILTLDIKDQAGLGVNPTQVIATLGRATHVADDITPQLIWNGETLSAPVSVAPGYWTLWVDITAQDGTPFRRRIPLHVEKEVFQ